MNENNPQLLLQEMSPFLLAFVREIIQTGNAADTANLAAAKMKKLGYDEVSVDEAGNLLGRIGSGEAALLFVGHMDIEGPHALSPCHCEVRSGRIYGPGAADAKCPLAAAIYGAALAKKAGLPPNKAIYVYAAAEDKPMPEAVTPKPRGTVFCRPTGLKIAADCCAAEGGSIRELGGDHPLIQTAAMAYAMQEGTKPALCTADGPISGDNTDAIVLGPGSPAQAHGSDEFCSIDELISAVSIYADICLHF